MSARITPGFRFIGVPLPDRPLSWAKRRKVASKIQALFMKIPLTSVRGCETLFTERLELPDDFVTRACRSGLNEKATLMGGLFIL